MKVTEAIKVAGYGLSGDFGGLPRQTYYTPDGRVIKAIPCMREYAKKENGKVIETGVRDANYDRGWLPVMPTELKPHCPHCGEWHEAQEEINDCAVRIRKRNEWGNRLAKRYKKEEHEDIDSLRNEVAELKDMLKKVLEGTSERNVVNG